MDVLPGVQLGRYTILAPLGAGGMGEVYKARDTRIDREVALKVLAEPLTIDDHSLQRFEREARAAGALEHPNLVAIHDFGVHEGTPFIVMELLEGETLRAKLNSSHLAARKALDYAVQIANGLAAAHGKGIIHRDLKPENVFITRDGRVKILDFGLAKLRSRDDSAFSRVATEHHITAAGSVMGTVGYMSPEQVRGAEVDARSDIFAFGTILHEMLSGQSAFRRNTTADTTSAILRDDPPPLTGDVPPALVRIVSRCLEKSPEERFQSARDLSLDLREIDGAPPLPKSKSLLLAGAVAVLIALGILALRWARQSTPSAPVNERKMIAVLPFENLGDPAESYFAAGVTEEITSRLSAVRQLGVISRTSAVGYNRAGKTLKQIAQDLGVNYVLEGSVRWDRKGNRVRVTPQLIRVADDTHLWSEPYDRNVEQIFDVQSDIAEEVVHHLNVTLFEPEKVAIAARPTENLQAYEAYLRAGTISWRETEPDERKAIALLEDAVRLDPRFALAHAALGQVHGRMYHHGFDRTLGRLAAAKRSIDAALAIDPKLPQARASLAYYYYWGFLDYDKALAEFAIARRSLPNDAELLQGVAVVHRRQGRFEEAIREQQSALQVDPRNATLMKELAFTLTVVRRYEMTDEAVARAIAIAPDDTEAHLLRAENLFRWKGSTVERRKILEQMPDIQNEISVRGWYSQDLLERRYPAALERLRSGNIAVFHFSRGTSNQSYLPKELLMGELYALLHDQKAARESYKAATAILEKAAGENRDNARIYSALGLAYAGLARKREAVAEAERAVRMYPLAKDAYLGSQRLADLAQVYAAVGEKQRAEAILEQLVSIPSPLSVHLLRFDPAWDPLRGDPRFEALLRR